MSELNRIVVPMEIFSLPIKGIYELAIMSLVYNFGDNGLTMSNGKLAAQLKTHRRTIEKTIARLRKNGLLENGEGHGRKLVLPTALKAGLDTALSTVPPTALSGGGYRPQWVKLPP